MLKDMKEIKRAELTISDELELRKWALEMSIKYDHILLPHLPEHEAEPSEILNNAIKIAALITDGWGKSIIDNHLSSKDA